MDPDHYDEFGNYIGPELASDESSEEDDDADEAEGGQTGGNAAGGIHDGADDPDDHVSTFSGCQSVMRLKDRLVGSTGWLPMHSR